MLSQTAISTQDILTLFGIITGALGVVVTVFIFALKKEKAAAQEIAAVREKMVGLEKDVNILSERQTALKQMVEELLNMMDE
jgi:hypothetical protein